MAGWGNTANGKIGGGSGSSRSGGWGNTADGPTTSTPPRQSHSSHHHGLFGGLKSAGHFVADKAERAARDLKAIPGGTYDLVNTEQHLLRKTIAHPLANPNDPRYGVNKGRWGTHANALVHGLEKSTVDSLHHPLRDPFATALTVLPILGAAGKAADIASAGRISAADRALDVNGERIPIHASRNAATKGVQLAHDKVVQRAIDTNPEGRIARYGTKRVGGAIQETARHRARLRDVPATMLEQAAGRLTKTPLRHGSRVEQAALELTSVNTSPEDAAAYHASQAAEQQATVRELSARPELGPRDRRLLAEAKKAAPRNVALSKLYGKVAEKGWLTKNGRGQVIVDAGVHPKLAETDVRLAAVQGKGDEVLAKYGVRTAEELAARVDRPAQVRAGATYEKPTPGKLGQSPPLDRAQRRVDSLQRRYDQLAAKGDVGGYRDTSRPRTETEARTLLTKLEAKHAAFEQGVHDRMFPEKLTEQELAEQRFRNQETGRARRQATGKTRSGRWSGASGRKSKIRPTVRADRMKAVETEIQRTLKAAGDHPSARRMLAERDMIYQLRSQLEPSPEEVFGTGPRAPREFGTVADSVYKGPTRPRLERLGGALSVAKDELARHQNRVANATKPTGFVGSANALDRRGRGFVSYRTEEPRAPKGAIAASAGPVVGEPRSPITNKTFTGGGIERGYVPKEVTGQAGRHYAQIMRFVNTSEHRLQAIKTGSHVRTTSRDVLVKIPGETAAKIPAAVNEILGKGTITTDDLDGLNAALQEFKADLVPGLRDRFATDRSLGIGTPAPDGYTWVDRNVLGDLAKPGQGPRGRVVRSLDNINSAVTAATVYFKIGHVGTRVLTNAVSNIIQGSAAPTELGRSVKLWHAIDEHDQMRALAAAGQHGFVAMPHEGVSMAAKVAGHGARWWAKHADAPFRFNALAYEARRAGIDTPEEFHSMLDKLENQQGLNAAQTAKVDWIAKRANREAIAYDRLSEGERRYLTRAVWFYPWVKGTMQFAVNTGLEHPYKAGAFGVVAAHGRQQQQQDLGDLPTYVSGAFKVGGSKESPTVADFSTFSPFATPADVLEAVARPEHLSDQLTPALSAGTHLIFGLDQYGNATKSPVAGALSTLVSPTPEAQIVNAYLNRGKPQNRKMFPASPRLGGTLSPLMRALVGPGMPRKLNPGAAHSNAARERRGLR